MRVWERAIGAVCHRYRRASIYKIEFQKYEESNIDEIQEVSDCEEHHQMATGVEIAPGWGQQGNSQQIELQAVIKPRGVIKYPPLEEMVDFRWDYYSASVGISCLHDASEVNRSLIDEFKDREHAIISTPLPEYDDSHRPDMPSEPVAPPVPKRIYRIPRTPSRKTPGHNLFNANIPMGPFRAIMETAFAGPKADFSKARPFRRVHKVHI